MEEEVNHRVLFRIIPKGGGLSKIRGASILVCLCMENFGT